MEGFDPPIKFEDLILRGSLLEYKCTEWAIFSAPCNFISQRKWGKDLFSFVFFFGKINIKIDRECRKRGKANAYSAEIEFNISAHGKELP
jgi:hypothetical protein